MVVYGIASCDTCRTARKALEASGREVVFRDVRSDPLGATERARFLEAFGDRLINRASTTWRSLGEAERVAEPDALLARYPTLMKRPVIDTGAELHLGWGREVQAAILP